MSSSRDMFLKLLLLLLLLPWSSSAKDLGFVYNGFTPNNLTLTGIAELTANGLLDLTSDNLQKIGRAFYPDPITFKNTANASVSSFSTTFVFGIIPQYPTIGGHGIAFVVAPQKDLPGAIASQYLGLFNTTNDGNDTNHVFAVELDTIQSTEFEDINDNHVGIDINSLNSLNATTAGYYGGSGGGFTHLSLIRTRPMQLWIDYDAGEKRISVALAPFKATKPRTPLLTLAFDLSIVFEETMYVGFSSSTGSVIITSHYLLGWSFKLNGIADALTLSKLPKFPRVGAKPISKTLTVGVPIISVFLLLSVISTVVYYVRRRRKFAEILEDWERVYGPHRFKFKDLYIATKGFKDQELLGAGGFGRVYRGVLPTSKLLVAVKRVSHESKQGIREFVAEIISIGRLRHRNIVTLLGYCRRKGELLLVYEYMPNGSLDKYLYNNPKMTLNWCQRFRIIKGVASGLLYLHEGWEQVVIHRDIKASNVLLDGELNARLGDFGLSRLYDHGTDPQTTHVVGTLGYLAPEHTRTGKATKSTDIFAFGAFVLEVVTGQQPINVRDGEDVILVDRVFSFWKRGEILEARDPNLGDNFVAEEVELGLKLGLICSHMEPDARPTIRQVLQYFEGDMSLKELSALGITSSGLTFAHHEGFDNFAMSDPSSVDRTMFSITSSIVESHLSSGR